jgi:hypothetical protein
LQRRRAYFDNGRIKDSEDWTFDATTDRVR